jgi:hypothetical protein
MTSPLAGFQELYELVGDQCEGRLTPSQVSRIEELVLGDADQRRRYILCMHTQGQIERSKQRRMDDPVLGDSGQDREDSDAGPMIHRMPAHADFAGGAAPTDHSLFVIHHFGPLSGVLFSYALAALVFAVGAIATWWWGAANGLTQLAQEAVLTPAQRATAATDPEPPIVAKITAMSNCQWPWPYSQDMVRVADPVPAGRAYVMTSGLLEITYESGAKVILQGPVAYMARSLNGGTLLLGKLTVRAAKLERAALEKSEIARKYPLPSPRVPPAFCLKTHSAVVLANCDQDTEFGVEVDNWGATYTSVFHGSIVLDVPGMEPCGFPAGYRVWTGAGPKHDGLLVFKPGPDGTPIFAQETPKPPPVCVLKPGAGKSARTAKGG